MHRMRVLVTGASGGIGSALIPRLAAAGHELRALSREPTRIAAPGVEVLAGDVLTGTGLQRALAGVEVAYYLVHSMEAAGAEPQQGAAAIAFPDRERLGAQRFAIAARRAGVRRIVYLGGPSPAGETSSRHLRSRAEVERTLIAEIPDSVALRAAIVIGARSRSFRLLVRLVERLPLLALPAWRDRRVQPIDERDVVEMLLAAASASEVAGMSLEIGGPDALTYEQMLSQIAEIMLVSRPKMKVDLSLTPIVARLAAAIADEDPELVLPLMESLACEMPPADERAAGMLGVTLHSFDAAVEHALAEWERVEPLAAR
jgi:uncharacterized protein YbjT (DUF2867 family)